MNRTPSGSVRPRRMVRGASAWVYAPVRRRSRNSSGVSHSSYSAPERRSDSDSNARMVSHVSQSSRDTPSGSGATSGTGSSMPCGKVITKDEPCP